MIKQKIVHNRSANIYMEFLLAFSLWLILFSTILPAFLHITSQRMEMLIEKEAIYHVTDQTINYMLQKPIQSEISGRYTDYFLSIEQGENRVVLCVQYVLKNREERRVCRTIQQ